MAPSTVVDAHPGDTLGLEVAARVLIISPVDLTERLGRTVLWRQDIERVFAADADLGFDLARAQSPNLTVIDAGSLPGASRLIERLRAEETTRRLSLVAIAGTHRDSREEALRPLGAN